MSCPPIMPKQLFAIIVEKFVDNPGVTPPASGKKFGSSTLKVHNKIFAMLVENKLVFKLPKARVDTLIASGVGEHFDPRHEGRLMKEWVAIETISEEEAISLAREAINFVAS